MIEPGIEERLRAGWAAGIRKEDRIRRRDKVAMETATPNPEPEVAIIMEEKAEKVAVMDHQTEVPPPPAPVPARGKRRYWTAEEKAAILAETYQPGVTVVAASMG